MGPTWGPSGADRTQICYLGLYRFLTKAIHLFLKKSYVAGTTENYDTHTKYLKHPLNAKLEKHRSYQYISNTYSHLYIFLIPLHDFANSHEINGDIQRSLNKSWCSEVGIHYIYYRQLWSVVSNTYMYMILWGSFGYALRQWETTFHYNVISHWPSQYRTDDIKDNRVLFRICRYVVINERSRDTFQLQLNRHAKFSYEGADCPL